MNVGNSTSIVSDAHRPEHARRKDFECLTEKHGHAGRLDTFVDKISATYQEAAHVFFRELSSPRQAQRGFQHVPRVAVLVDRAPRGSRSETPSPAPPTVAELNFVVPRSPASVRHQLRVRAPRAWQNHDAGACSKAWMMAPTCSARRSSLQMKISPSSPADRQRSRRWSDSGYPSGASDDMPPDRLPRRCFAGGCGGLRVARAFAPKRTSLALIAFQPSSRAPRTGRPLQFSDFSQGGTRLRQPSS